MSAAVPDPADTTVCAVCKKKHICRVFEHQLGHDVKFCDNCKSFQDWRRLFSGQHPVVIAGGLVTVIGALYGLYHWIWFGDSQTKASLNSASTQNISIRVENRGDRGSVILWCKLHYTKLTEQDLPLEMKEGGVVSPNSVSNINLSMRLRPAAEPASTATVVIHVGESNGDEHDLTVPLTQAFVEALQRRFAVTNRGDP